MSKLTTLGCNTKIKNNFSILLLSLLLVTVFISIPVYANAESEVVVWVDDDFDASTSGWEVTHWDEIQEGVDAVVDGGTVYVASGTYYENIDVEHNVTIIGAGATDTIVVASYEGDHVFEVTASGVSISGLTATGANKASYRYRHKSGVYIDGVDNCTVNSVIATGNNIGILLDHSKGSTVTRSTAIYNIRCGIYLDWSNGNEISYNNASLNSVSGTWAYTQSWAGIGIYLDRSSDNELIGNIANMNGGGSQYSGIGVYLDRCPTESWRYVWTPTGWEITVTYFSPNVLIGNTANENIGLTNYEYSGIGILLWQSGGTSNTRVILAGNTANLNKYFGTNRKKSGSGIVLYQTHYATLTDNTVEANQEKGYYSEGAIGNFVHDNVIVGTFACGNKIGFYLENDASLYFFNDITSSGFTGVEVVNSGLESQSFATKFNFNAIIKGEWKVKNKEVHNFNAKNNWWGTSIEDEISSTVDEDVDYNPWLEAEVGVEDYVIESIPSGETWVDVMNVSSTRVFVNTTIETTMLVFNYEDNPGMDFDDDMGTYIDVYLSDVSGVERVEVRIYHTDNDWSGRENMYYLNGSEWLECSSTGVDVTGGYIWAIIDDSTIPDLSYLSGGPFGNGDNPGNPTVGEDVADFVQDSATILTGLLVLFGVAFAVTTLTGNANLNDMIAYVLLIAILLVFALVFEGL